MVEVTKDKGRVHNLPDQTPYVVLIAAGSGMSFIVIPISAGAAEDSPAGAQVDLRRVRDSEYLTDRYGRLFVDWKAAGMAPLSAAQRVADEIGAPMLLEVDLAGAHGT